MSEPFQNPASQDDAATSVPWPEACQSLHDLSGWGEVDCATRESFMGDWRDKLTPFSTLTDPDGQYGPGVVYTEWGVKDGEKPWLRDYRWTVGPCRHYMPVANIAWPAGKSPSSGSGELHG